MNALSHEFHLSPATAFPAVDERRQREGSLVALDAQWDAIHEAASAVGLLAQLGEEEPGEEIRSLPQRLAEMDDSRRELARRAIDDLAAVLQTGLQALLSAHAGGHDTTSAALTLWREFHQSRDAILTVASTR